jgi:NAD(P)-dependent dehydrogenase (short-subunit alcohol dehydrogenase family)
MTEKQLALVTGAARRLGKAFAMTLARRGFAIALHYRHSAQEAMSAANEIRKLGVPAYLLRADLKDPKKIPHLFSIIDELDEPLKIVVNSAAIMPAANPVELSVRDWDEAFDLNLRAPFFLAQEAAKRMESGLIVNVSDVGAQKAWSRYPSYTVSKSAVESLTKMLARAFAPSIRVNAIAPGLVLQSDVVSPEEWQRLIARLPLKRSATLDEVTSVLEFLLANEYITGQTIVVDGGYSLLG